MPPVGVPAGVAAVPRQYPRFAAVPGVSRKLPAGAGEGILERFPTLWNQSDGSAAPKQARSQTLVNVAVTR